MTSKDTAKSPHAFMAEALGVQGRLLEARRTFLAAALSAEAAALESGMGYPAADIDAYFEALGTESDPPPLKASPWRK
jgi:hypothetical protein